MTDDKGGEARVRVKGGDLRVSALCSSERVNSSGYFVVNISVNKFQTLTMKHTKCTKDRSLKNKKRAQATLSDLEIDQLVRFS
jgi:hypothetical protein